MSQSNIADAAVAALNLFTSCSTDEELARVLAAKMSLALDVGELPRNYFLGAGAVLAGKIPSFGFRREHLRGNVPLEDWVKNRRSDLRALSTKRALA